MGTYPCVECIAQIVDNLDAIFGSQGLIIPKSGTNLFIGKGFLPIGAKES